MLAHWYTDMAKAVKKVKSEEIETDPGAWERFEHAVDAAVKSGPKHRTASKPHLKTPPRQHQEDVGKKQPNQTGAPGKGKAKEEQTR